MKRINYKLLAKSLGLTYWSHGGYFYLSGLINGKHKQGIFESKKSIQNEIKEQFERLKYKGGF